MNIASIKLIGILQLNKVYSTSIDYNHCCVSQIAELKRDPFNGALFLFGMTH